MWQKWELGIQRSSKIANIEMKCEAKVMAHQAKVSAQGTSEQKSFPQMKSISPPARKEGKERESE